MNKTLKGISYAASVAALAFGAIVVPGGGVFAEDPCAIANGAVNINGATLCVMDSTVNTINFEGTIEQLHAMMHAFKNNAGYGYNENSVINAKITTAVSMGNLAVISAATPAGATVVITPTTDFVWDDLNTSLPTGYSVNWDKLAVHLPEGTTAKKALEIYNGINNDTVTVAVNESSLTVAKSEKYGKVVHLPEGTSISEAYSLANEVNKTDTVVVASGMDYWIQAGDGKTTVSVLSANALTAALATEGLNEVHVNLDITVETINIPAGKTVIEDGAILTIKNMNESEIKGSLDVLKEDYTAMGTSNTDGVTTAQIDFGTALNIDCLATLKIDVEDSTALSLTNGGELHKAFDLTVVDRNGVEIAVSDNNLVISIGISAEDYETLKAYDKLWMVYFDNTGAEAERMPAELIEDNGVYTIKFETTHLSTYGVVGVNATAAAPETGAMAVSGASAVNTGAITLAVMTAVATIAGVAMIIAKRKKEA